MKTAGGAARFWLAVVAVLACALIALAVLDSPPGPAPSGLFEIPAGAGAGQVAAALERTGHIRSRLWFRALSRALGWDGRLKAGYYRLDSGRRASQILNDLVSGRRETARVTLPEGWAVWQIAERLEAQGVCRAADFLAVAGPEEGFLFPETYFLELGLDPGEVVRRLRERFDAVWAEVMAEAAAAGRITPAENPGEFRLAGRRRWSVRSLVTMASLIEREASRAEEQALVSAVYHNRLVKRMRLECDPTVQYALGFWKSPLLKADLDVASPYNTYRHFGLPPGPICNPGRGALRAALAPAAVDYLYFVADTTGGHRFSVDYQDHLKAVRMRRRVLKVRRKS